MPLKSERRVQDPWFHAYTAYQAALWRWEARWSASPEEWAAVQRLHDEAYRLLHAPA